MGLKANREAIEKIIIDELWGRQMRFIAGPRQCGKTTLAKAILKRKRSDSFYYNWDKQGIREKYRKDHDFFLIDIAKHRLKLPWICFDEIHKTHKWKNILKDFFDTYESSLRALITGSARLDLFRRSGDSLAGRYMLFHLFPFRLAELNGSKNLERPAADATKFIYKKLASENKSSQTNMELLLKFSGFPEPLFKSSSDFHRSWQRSYLQRTIYEDIKDLSQINDLDKVANLYEELSYKIASPLSINSLTSSIEANFATVKNYLRYLELAYQIFFVPPYNKRLDKSVKKEQKIYFYDWTRVNGTPAKYENYVACELHALVNYWTDAGYCDAQLFFIRNKNGNETDFLITIDKEPWLLIEVKSSSDQIASHHYNHIKQLGKIPFVQLNLESEKTLKPHPGVFIMPAHQFLT